MTATRRGCIAAVLLIALTGCADDEHADAASARKPTASASTTPPPERSLTALDTVACQQAVTAMGPVDDTISGLRDGDRYAAFLIAQAFTRAAEKVQTTADAVTDPQVKEALTGLAAANTFAGEKADAYRSGRLELASEVEAIEDAEAALVAACRS